MSGAGSLLEAGLMSMGAGGVISSWQGQVGGIQGEIGEIQGLISSILSDS